ncbi:MAG: metallophosphoesterase [Gammaproteobacteria bacterium]|nr:metallophosphoesterase [Gammaproteobacteria bacterium]
MTNFNWLHLTDFHLGMEDHACLWPGMKERFFEDLKRLGDKCGQWDLVLFTGDLTHSGEAAQFKKLDKLLSKLPGNPLLLAVPGNHDLERPARKDPSVRLLQEWDKHPDIQKEFWKDPNSPYRQIVTNAFKNYTDWQKAHTAKLRHYRSGMLPGDFSVTIKKQGAELGIVGLNTSFLQLTGDDYKNKLALHARQFHDACGGDGAEWAKKHHACLLLTHHPPDWLTSQGQKYLNGEITDHGRFAAHLCGHLHETAYCNQSEAGTETRRTWQNRSLFGLEYFGNEAERLHGYTAGRIELKGKKGILSFWPREAKLQSGQRNIVPDYSVVLTGDQHTEQVQFALHKPYGLSSSPGKKAVADGEYAEITGPQLKAEHFVDNSQKQNADSITKTVPLKSCEQIIPIVRKNLIRQLERQKSLHLALQKEMELSGNPAEIADKLCESNELEWAIINLHNAVQICLENLSDDQQNSDRLRRMRQSALEILGWLLLLFVKHGWVAQNFGRLAQGAHIDFTPHLQTKTGVEITLARLGQRPAALEIDLNKRKIAGKDSIDSDSLLEMGWKEEDILKGVKRELWKKTYPEKGDKAVFAKTDDEQLKYAIKLHRKMRKADYYVTASENANPLLKDPKMSRVLADSLELRLVLYGIAGSEEILIELEYKLEKLVNEFLQTLHMNYEL